MRQSGPNAATGSGDGHRRLRADGGGVRAGFLAAQYLQLALRYEPFGVGVRLLPATGLALIISPIPGRLADRLGEGGLVAAGLGLLAAGLVLIGVLVTGLSGYGTVVGQLFLAGAGIATAFPTVATAAMRSASPGMVGVASGVSNTIRHGAMFGVASATAIFASRGGYATPSEFVDGLRPAFIVLGLLCSGGAILAGFMIRRPNSDDVAAPPGHFQPRHRSTQETRSISAEW